ncbi:MAG: radical SAM protein [Candidatus Brocadiia bacterium]|nr:radical SAM protein [Candidatus Brocadiia bacterium]
MRTARRRRQTWKLHLSASFLYDPLARMRRLRGPFSAHIQTVDRCNAACPTCPYRTSWKTGPPHYMGEDLYLRIIDELRRRGSLRLLELMLQNEPLLDGSLAKRVRQARLALGRGLWIATVTNGSMLTDERIDELLAAGLNCIDVSIDAAHEQAYQAIRPGLDFAKVVESSRTLLRRRGKAVVRVRFLKQRANVGEECELERYWKPRGAIVRLDSMLNRAGSLGDFGRLRRPWDGALRHGMKVLLGRFYPRCLYPFGALTVLSDGRIILCCNDWAHELIVGDLTRQSVAEVWHGERTSECRHLIWAQRFRDSCVCRDCSIARGGAGQR